MHNTFRPLQLASWGRPLTPAFKRRSKWTFSAEYSDTVILLDKEISLLGGKSFVIEADFREQDIRQDGMPRSNARQPSFPGVRVAFESKHGPLIYQTDSCESWRHNVRSIALGLEALRAVDRFGISSRAEQYTGYLSLGAGRAMPAGKTAMGEDEAREVVRLLSRSDRSTPLADQWKYARSRAHPDTGGSAEDWARLSEAGKALGILDEKGRTK